jgi:hypothetical protein
MTTTTKNRKKIAIFAIVLYCTGMHFDLAHAIPLPFAPGEKLKYALRWENIPAGEMLLEIRPMTSINGSPAYHFVMIAKSNAFVDIFCKIRDRIDAYANAQMTHSMLYRKKQTGGRKIREAEVKFDWINNSAQYADTGRTRDPIALLPGSFDPLSAFYFIRMAVSDQQTQIQRPVTNGKKNFIGNAKVVGRETITLTSGKRYDTFILEPKMGIFGGVFKESKGATLRIWVTADAKRIPVQIKSKVKVGNFTGELVSAEGI